MDMKTTFTILPILAVSTFAPLDAAQTTLSGSRYEYSFTPPASVVPPYFVTQSLSADQVARNVTSGGVFDADSNSIKWGPFLNAEERALAFDVIGQSTSVSAPIVVTADSETTLAVTPAQAPANPFLVWMEESLPSVPPTQRAVDGNMDGDQFPNFAEYILGFDASVFNPASDALRLSPDGLGGFNIELERVRGLTDFQVLVEQVDLSSGDTMPMTPVDQQNAGDFVTELFNQNSDSVFVRLVFLPFASEEE
ncbi:MAG: hypothetical protein ACQKBV_00380 [Puniceicoccales bacterium]